MPHTSDVALKRLLGGNKRYCEGKAEHLRQGQDRRSKLITGQAPFAVILGCSDSRVPPEIIFDQGLGDLFVIRVAGNIANNDVIASIEYAAAHLDTPLIVVLAHSKCGAVGAAVAGGEAGGHLPELLGAIKPAVDASQGEAGDAVDNAARLNARMTAEKLVSCGPVLNKLADAGVINVVAAFYDLESGRVEILD